MCNFYWDSAILQRTLEDITQWKNHVFISLVTLTISSVQSLSRIQLFVTPWTEVCQASLSITNSQSLSVVPFSSCLQSFPASGSFPMSQFFASGGQRTGVSASASVLPNEYSGVISFRIDWLGLLAIQKTQEFSPRPQFKSININYEQLKTYG